MSTPRVWSTETAFLRYMAICRGCGEPKQDAFLEFQLSIGIATLQTLERWEASLKAARSARRLNGRSPKKVFFARGQTLLLLRCFLQREGGFRIRELESLHPYMRELAEITSLGGTFTLEYATDHLKYANSRQLINALVKGTEIDPPRMALLRQLVG